jgi:hypothetical protein
MEMLADCTSKGLGLSGFPNAVYLLAHQKANCVYGGLSECLIYSAVIIQMILAIVKAAPRVLWSGPRLSTD